MFPFLRGYRDGSFQLDSHDDDWFENGSLQRVKKKNENSRRKEKEMIRKITKIK